MSCFIACPNCPHERQLGNGWDITIGDWTPGAEHMGREGNAADTKVFIVSHSDLFWMIVKKE